MRAPNVSTISPALPFLDTFVDALLAGQVVPGFAAGDDPLHLAETTIYVPTRRAARALGDAFLARAPNGAAVLPRILPLGVLEATETSLVLAELDPAAAGLPLPAPASHIWRRLRLAALIQQWARAIGKALRTVDSTGRPVVDANEAFQVASSPVDAFALAGELAGLIDEMLIEGVAWHALDELEMAGFDDYWRITTSFLSIAFGSWPKQLEDAGLIEPAARQIALVEAQTRRLAEAVPPRPVIAIGSTGTNKATARLLAAIARAPQGAVVLPGLDLALDGAAWRIIEGELEAGEEPSFGHPQAAMARLLPTLGIARTDVKALGAPVEAAALRTRVVAEALRPADTTDLWRGFRRTHPQKTLAAALAGIALVEAADEREEALCIAIAMREALETPGLTAALVTPDRELARRVRGELLRWQIEVDDTGGEPLALRPLGVLARLVVGAGRSAGAREIGALLAHPLAAFDRARAEVARLAAALEVGVLRAVALRGKSAERIFAEAREVAADYHAHPAQQALTPADWRAMEALWRDGEAALGPLTALDGAQPLAVWVTAHRAALAAISDPGPADEAEALDALFDELAAEAPGALAFTASDYEVLVGRLLGEVVLRNTDRPHPRLQILGLLEARLIRADLMILGGLDESIWPPQARADPFLNRPMRRAMGLTPPERRIGQTAHDFEQAMGAHRVLLTRAAKRGGSPCVASRFVLRLEALTGKAWSAVREAGRRPLELARLIDRRLTEPAQPKRPRPTPPVELRPRELSVTQIETLRRDPYAIYARHILGLAPLPAVAEDIEASEYGSLMHQALHRFSKAPDAGGTEQMRKAALLGILRDVFAPALADPSFAAFRWPVIRKSAEVFLLFDADQRRTMDDIATETSGRMALTLADQSAFVLKARADRIDFHRDGRATLIDYKTGQPPGNSEIAVGFAPQLTLEAAILRDGGFGRTHAGPTEAIYLKLGGRDGGRPREVAFGDKPFEDVVADHLAGLIRLLSSLRDPGIAYPSRPFPKFAKDYGDYDHLARVREWTLAADEEVSA